MRADDAWARRAVLLLVRRLRKLITLGVRL